MPEDFEVPLELATDRFRLEPLGPEHNERDREAWMSSIAHIRATPGFPDGKWPTEMSAAQNLADLVRHAGDFAARTGFTYSVLDGDEVIGCVYLYPAHDGDHDVEASSLVRASRAELDVVRRRLSLRHAPTDGNSRTSPTVEDPACSRPGILITPDRPLTRCRSPVLPRPRCADRGTRYRRSKSQPTARGVVTQSGPSSAPGNRAPS